MAARWRLVALRSSPVVWSVSVLTVRMDQNMQQIALCFSSEKTYIERFALSMFFSDEKHKTNRYIMLKKSLVRMAFLHT